MCNESMFDAFLGSSVACQRHTGLPGLWASRRHWRMGWRGSPTHWLLATWSHEFSSRQARWRDRALYPCARAGEYPWRRVSCSSSSIGRRKNCDPWNILDGAHSSRSIQLVIVNVWINYQLPPIHIVPLWSSIDSVVSILTHWHRNNDNVRFGVCCRKIASKQPCSLSPSN